MFIKKVEKNIIQIYECENLSLKESNIKVPGMLNNNAQKITFLHTNATSPTPTPL